MLTHSESITQQEKVPMHLCTGIEKSIARSHNKRKSSRDSGDVRDAHLEREKILSEQKVWISVGWIHLEFV